MPGSVWTGTISFGLVAVPVRMVSATRDLDVHFHQIDARSGERVQIRRVTDGDGDGDGDGAEVAWEEVGHGYELDGRLVVLSDDELDAAAPEHTHTIEIEEFVDGSGIDPAHYDHPYFLLPGADSEGVTRAYGLLRDAIARTGQVAIGRLVLRAREHLVAVRERDGLLALETMVFADEIRGAGEIDAVPDSERWKPTRGELSAATQLIDAMTRDFDPPAFEDRHRARLLELIEGKRKAGGRKRAGPAPAAPDPPAAPDLMAALRDSLARAKQG